MVRGPAWDWEYARSASLASSGSALRLSGDVHSSDTS